MWSEGSRSRRYRSEVLLPVAFREFRVAGSCAYPSCMHCKGEADHCPRGRKGRGRMLDSQIAGVRDLGPSTREPVTDSTFALTAASVWASLDIQYVLHNSWLMRNRRAGRDCEHHRVPGERVENQRYVVWVNSETAVCWLQNLASNSSKFF